MENEITIFFNNMRLLPGLESAVETHSKQVRIPISSQMFQKSNMKGLAILLYPLMTMMIEVLPKGQQTKLAASITSNWFPYGLAEIKCFKTAVMQAADALATAGHLPGQEDKSCFRNTVLTKNVLETAQGSKVWRALRLLSDQAVRQ